MMFSLKGMNALVTGASGGIGSSIAHALASQGARLALSGSNASKLRAFRDELNETYAHHDHDGHVEITCDLGQHHPGRGTDPRDCSIRSAASMSLSTMPASRATIWGIADEGR